MLTLRLAGLFRAFCLLLALQQPVMSHEQPFLLFDFRHQPLSVKASISPLQLLPTPSPPPQLHASTHRASQTSSRSLAKRDDPDSAARGAIIMLNQFARYTSSARGRAVSALSTAVAGGYAVVGYVVLVGSGTAPASVPALVVFGVSGFIFGMSMLVVLYWLDEADMLPIPGLPLRDSGTTQQPPRRRAKDAVLRSMRGFAAATGRAFRRASPAEVRLLQEMVREKGRPLVAKLA